MLEASCYRRLARVLRDQPPEGIMRSWEWGQLQAGVSGEIKRIFAFCFTPDLLADTKAQMRRRLEEDRSLVGLGAWRDLDAYETILLLGIAAEFRAHGLRNAIEEITGMFLRDLDTPHSALYRAPVPPKHHAFQLKKGSA